MANERQTRRKGFTGVELVVAMSISAITLLSGYELFEALKETGDRQSEDLAVMAEIMHGLDVIRDDLLHALPRKESQDPIFAGSDPNLDNGDKARPLLEFYSLCSGYDKGSFGLRQMCRVTYELARYQDSVRLYRTATPVVAAGSPSAGESRESILDRIEQIKITFHNGHSVESSFSSNKALPVCVSLTVTAYGRAWPLSVKLPCGVSEAQS